jgi:hypothetical protein
MRVFSIEEANALLPAVRGALESIQRAHRRLIPFQNAARDAAEAAERGGGGISGGAIYARALTQLALHTGQLESLGVQIKDYTRGLIDFPSLRDGRVVLLCWQLGEGNQIEWWHDVEAGFAGRQPL